MTRMAWGAGLTTEATDGTTLDAWYRWYGWGEFGDDDMVAEYPDLDVQLGMREQHDDLRNVVVRPVRLSIDVDAEPESAVDAYLRLHLLSSRLAPPHSLNVDGIFGALNNAVWTNLGPVAVSELDDVRLRVKQAGQVLHVHGVDKFPRMLDYVVPTRSADRRRRRVRLGAHLADGTVVMHEGFCNFNAGTLGTSMVEGRITAGVVVGDGSDVGGGASIMGTLSGGGTETISIGEALPAGRQRRHRHQPRRRLRRRGRPLHHRLDPVSTPDGVVKARELSGISGTLFFRDGQTGQVIARPRTKSWGELNDALHTGH